MKRVALVNGAARQFKYNQMLSKQYEDLGYTAKEFKYPLAMLFSCHLHKYLHQTVRDIVENHDVIHCESGGYFPLLPYYVEQKHTKPLILESPVLAATTGTLLAGLSLSPTYDVPDNVLVQTALDTFCFTPAWTQRTLAHIETLKQKNQALVLGSLADKVSDNRGKEQYYHHLFVRGQHGRLFYDNDFGVVKNYLETFDAKKFV